MAIIKISNIPLLNGVEKSSLSIAPAAGDTSIVVKDSSSFSSTNKFVLVGQLGYETSEIKRISSVSGTTINLTAALTYSHSIDDQVTQLDFDQVEFHRVATATTPTAGDASVIATVSVESDDQYTSYNDTTNSTGYAYAFYKNSITADYSSVSGAIPYTGVALNSVRKMKDQGLQVTHESITELITEQFLTDELNNWQQDVTRLKDWEWEYSSTTDTLVAGQKSYTLPTSVVPKYTDESRAFLQVRLKNLHRLDYEDKRQYDMNMEGTISSTLNGGITSGATSIVLTSTADFPTAGTALIGDGLNISFTWTGNTTATNTLTGVTGISESHSSGATVWLISSLGLPTRYTVYNGSVLMEPVPSSTYNGYTIFYDFVRAIPALVNDSDTTVIPFYHTAQYYLAWKIEALKGNQSNADYWRQLYENRVAGELKRSRPQQFFSFRPQTRPSARASQ